MRPEGLRKAFVAFLFLDDRGLTDEKSFLFRPINDIAFL